MPPLMLLGADVCTLILGAEAADLRVGVIHVGREDVGAHPGVELRHRARLLGQAAQQRGVPIAGGVGVQ